MESPVRICFGIVLASAVLFQIATPLPKPSENQTEASGIESTISTQTPAKASRSRLSQWNRRNYSNFKVKESSKDVDSNELLAKETSSESPQNINDSKEEEKGSRGRVRYSVSSSSEKITRTHRRTPLLSTAIPQNIEDDDVVEKKNSLPRITRMGEYRKTMPNLLEDTTLAPEYFSSTPRYFQPITTPGENDEYDKYSSPEFHDVNNIYTLPGFSDIGQFMNEGPEYNDKRHYRDFTLPAESNYNDVTVKKKIKRKPSTFDDEYGSPLTTPHSVHFDRRFKEVSMSIMKNFLNSQANKTRMPTEDEQQNDIKELLDKAKKNTTKIYIKNTKKITLTDSDNDGSKNQELSDVHGTSIYYEMSMVTDSYDSDDCDNETTTQAPEQNNVETFSVVSPTLSSEEKMRNIAEGKSQKLATITTTEQTSTSETKSLEESTTTYKPHKYNRTDILRSTTRRIKQYTTPKPRRRMLPKKRIDPVVSLTTKAPSPNLYFRKPSELLRMTTKFGRKTPFTTIASDIDPVFQSESSDLKQVLKAQVVQDNTIPALSKRGSQKENSSEDSSTDNSMVKTSLMSIPPTSPAWALIAMNTPPVKNRTSAPFPLYRTRTTTRQTVKPVPVYRTTTAETPTEVTVQATKATIDQKTEDTTISFNTPEPKFDQDSVMTAQSIQKTRADNKPWTPIIRANSRRKVTTESPTTEVTFSWETSTETANAQNAQTEYSQTYNGHAQFPPLYTENWIPIVNITDEDNKLNAQLNEAVKSPTISEAVDPSFESITKIANRVTTPTSDIAATAPTNGNTNFRENYSTTTIGKRRLRDRSTTTRTFINTISRRKTTTEGDTTETTTYLEPSRFETSTKSNEIESTTPIYFFEVSTIEADTTSNVEPTKASTVPTTEQWHPVSDIDYQTSEVLPTTMHSAEETIEELPITTYRPKGRYQFTNEYEETTVMPVETTAMPVETTVMPAETTVMPAETTGMPAETTVMGLETTVMAVETTDTEVSNEDAEPTSSTTETPTTTITKTGTTTIKKTPTTTISSTTETKTVTNPVTTMVINIVSSTEFEPYTVTEIITSREELTDDEQVPETEENSKDNEVSTETKEIMGDVNQVDDTTTIQASTKQDLTEPTSPNTEFSGKVGNVTVPSEELSTSLSDSVSEYMSENNEYTTEAGNLARDPLMNGAPTSSGATIAIAVSVIGVIALILVVALLVVLRRRGARGGYGQRCTPVSLDAYSLDSVSVGRHKGAARMRASKRSYGNPAYDDEVVVSHPMQYPALRAFSLDGASAGREFAAIPSPGVRADEVPAGCERKNRYANALPPPETRVPLARLHDDPTTEYINANYVSGPGGIKDYYIACQAPLANTVADFWRMIWEQNARLVIMLTEYMENGIEKCYEYLPPSEVSDYKRTFGDFQIILKRREHRDKYAISFIQLNNTVTKSWREIVHMWYFWPAKGVPDDYESVINFMAEMRGYMKAAQAARDFEDEESGAESNGRHRGEDTSSSGDVNVYSPSWAEERMRNGGGNSTLGRLKAASDAPVRPCVVHCSAGAGRTGALIALEACMRALDAGGACDVPRAVRAVRAARPGAVQNKHQYLFIYKVLSEYGHKLYGGGVDSI